MASSFVPASAAARPPSVSSPNSRRETVHAMRKLLKVTGYRWAILPHNFQAVTTMRRRDFIAALGALGTAAAISEWTPYAQAGAARRIDVHHHFAAPAWKKRMAESRRQGWDTFQAYDVSRSLE